MHYANFPPGLNALHTAAEGYDRRVGLRIGLCSAAADSMVSYLMKNHRWQQYAGTTAAVATIGTAAVTTTPARWLLREVARFPVSPAWAGFGWMWAGDAMYYGMLAAAEKSASFLLVAPPEATAEECSGSDDAGNGRNGNSESSKPSSDSEKKKSGSKKKGSVGGAAVQWAARCAAATIAAPFTALMLRAALSAAPPASSFSALSFLIPPFGTNASDGGNGGVLLATVGCRILSATFQEAVASRTLQYVKQQLQPKQPLREWLDANEVVVSPTTAMYIPPLVATLTADVVSTALLSPLEMVAVRMHADAMMGVAAAGPIPPVGSLLNLYSSVPGFAGSLGFETFVVRLSLVNTMMRKHSKICRKNPPPPFFSLQFWQEAGLLLLLLFSFSRDI